MEIHDVGLSCAEAQFPRLRQAFEAHGIGCRITSYHVLRAVSNGHKIDFDAAEDRIRRLA